jgi:hypothetical protein
LQVELSTRNYGFLTQPEAGDYKDIYQEIVSAEEEFKHLSFGIEFAICELTLLRPQTPIPWPGVRC